MTVLHSGSTQQYSDNWASAFGTRPAKTKKKANTGKKIAAKKRAPAKRATKRKSKA
jgi:hypothetical protein